MFIDEQYILRRYIECGNGGIIAKELGINNYQVYKCLRKNGINPKKVGGKEKYSASLMIQMYQDGLSISDICAKLDMSPSSIFERLKNNGIQFRDRVEALKDKIQIISDSEHFTIISLYQSGLFAADIAKKYNVNKSTIINILKKYNIEIRDHLGPNNPAWKGGRVPLHTMIRHSKKYEDWRNNILRSRDYTCQVSGQRSGKLNVHHIKHFKELLTDFIIKYNINSQTINSEELYLLMEQFTPFWDESNTLVVTEEIHKRIHSNGYEDLD